MTAAGPETPNELEDLLRRLEESQQQLVEALKSADSARFEKESAEGESLKRALERTSDDINFYYGQLAARALSLPQPPCLQRADFSSLREAAMSLQVAHRRFSNLLHDLAPADLEKKSSEGEEHPAYTLRQVLEMATAHYKLRAQQVKALSAPAGRRRTSTR